MEGTVVCRLREARRYLVFQQFLEYTVWGLFASLLVLAVSAAVSTKILQSELCWWAAVGCPILFASLGALRRWRFLESVARELDTRANAKDRFVSALALPTNEKGTVVDAARREMAVFAANLRVFEYLRPKIPGNIPWLLLPLFALVLVNGFYIWHSNELAPELTSAQKLVEEARSAAEHEAKKEEEFKVVVEQLEKTQKELTDSAEPLREALRALAELERKLSGQSGLDSAEITALAEAFASDHSELASQLRAGKSAEAARAVAELNPAEIAKALEQAARHLETGRLRELVDQIPATAKVQLVMMLSSSRRNGNEGGRHRFLATLRDLKNGTVGADQNSAHGIEIPSGREKSSASSADNAPPAGLPGSENDRASGENLSKETEPDNQPPADEDFVAGEIGEGSSLVELFRAAGNDDPKARRAYQDAYQTALPSALDAVSREQIPPGSRLLVRRYFEAIRPKE
jgi:hypothetical protein